MRDELLHGRVICWDDVPEDAPRAGIRRRGYATDSLQMVLNVCDQDIELRPHSHDEHDQLVYIAKGRALYYVDGEPHEMGPGSIMLVRAGSEHYIQPLEDGVENIDIFMPPREDMMHVCPIPGRNS